MSELRFDPFKNDWLIVGKEIENKSTCELCGTIKKVTECTGYLAKAKNPFGFSKKPEEIDQYTTLFFKAAQSYGQYEQITYSKEHDRPMYNIDDSEIYAFIDLLINRYRIMAKDKKIQYISILEERRLNDYHPHFKMIGFSYIPKKIEIELENTKNYLQMKSKCLCCNWTRNELRENQRIIFENEYFAVILPYFAQSKHQMRIVSKRHVAYLDELNASEKEALAKCLKQSTGLIDFVYNESVEYTINVIQAPINFIDSKSYFHSYIDIEIKEDDESKRNSLWLNYNMSLPEKVAIEMREARERYQEYVNAAE